VVACFLALKLQSPLLPRTFKTLPAAILLLVEAGTHQLAQGTQVMTSVTSWELRHSVCVEGTSFTKDAAEGKIGQSTFGRLAESGAQP